MTTRPDTPEVLDAFVEALQRGTDPAAVLDPAAAGAARDLHALAAASGPRPGFLEALESRLLATPVGAPVPLRRRIRRLLLAPLAALLVLAVGLAAASAASPVVRAQVERLACFVPGLGIRPCDVPGLIARQPTSVARGGTILTVTHLLSAGGETNVRIEITDLPAPPGGAGRDTRVRLRDPGGREYAARTGTHESGAVREGETGGSTTFSADWTFEALDRSVRAGRELAGTRSTGADRGHGPDRGWGGWPVCHDRWGHLTGHRRRGRRRAHRPRGGRLGGVYALLMWHIREALQERTFNFPPSPTVLYEDWINHPPEAVKRSIVEPVALAYAHNREQIGHKVDAIRIALWLLLAEVLVLVVGLVAS